MAEKEVELCGRREDDMVNEEARRDKLTREKQLIGEEMNVRVSEDTVGRREIKVGVKGGCI